MGDDVESLPDRRATVAEGTGGENVSYGSGRNRILEVLPGSVWSAYLERRDTFEEVSWGGDGGRDQNLGEIGEEESEPGEAGSRTTSARGGNGDHDCAGTACPDQRSNGTVTTDKFGERRPGMGVSPPLSDAGVYFSGARDVGTEVHRSSVGQPYGRTAGSMSEASGGDPVGNLRRGAAGGVRASRDGADDDGSRRSNHGHQATVVKSKGRGGSERPGEAGRETQGAEEITMEKAGYGDRGSTDEREVRSGEGGRQRWGDRREGKGHNAVRDGGAEEVRQRSRKGGAAEEGRGADDLGDGEVAGEWVARRYVTRAVEMAEEAWKELAAAEEQCRVEKERAVAAERAMQRMQLEQQNRRWCVDCGKGLPQQAVGDSKGPGGWRCQWCTRAKEEEESRVEERRQREVERRVRAEVEAEFEEREQALLDLRKERARRVQDEREGEVRERVYRQAREERRKDVVREGEREGRVGQGPDGQWCIPHEGRMGEERVGGARGRVEGRGRGEEARRDGWEDLASPAEEVGGLQTVRHNVTRAGEWGGYESGEESVHSRVSLSRSVESWKGGRVPERREGEGWSVGSMKGKVEGGGRSTRVGSVRRRLDEHDAFERGYREPELGAGRGGQQPLARPTAQEMEMAREAGVRIVEWAFAPDETGDGGRRRRQYEVVMEEVVRRNVILGEYHTTAWGEGSDERYAVVDGKGRLRDGRGAVGWHKWMNHSCRPNARLVTGVPGVKGIAIITLCLIEAGESVTFDYDWTVEEGQEHTRTRCLCGEEGCRGWVERVARGKGRVDEDAVRQGLPEGVRRRMRGSRRGLRLRRSAPSSSDESDDDDERSRGVESEVCEWCQEEGHRGKTCPRKVGGFRDRGWKDGEGSVRDEGYRAARTGAVVEEESLVREEDDNPLAGLAPTGFKRSDVPTWKLHNGKPTEPQMYVQEFEECAMMMGWTEEFMVHAVVLGMTWYTAKRWHRKWMGENQGKKKKWSQWKVAFLDRFLPEKTSDRQKRLLTAWMECKQKNSEDVEDYFLRYEEVAERFTAEHPDGARDWARRCAEQFVAGLSGVVRAGVVGRQHTDLAEAYSHAKDVYNALNPMPKERAARVAAVKKEQVELEEVVEQDPVHERAGGHQVQEEGVWRNLHGVRMCRTCKVEGHDEGNCAYRPAARVAPDVGCCWSCGEEDHTAAQCNRRMATRCLHCNVWGHGTWVCRDRLNGLPPGTIAREMAMGGGRSSGERRPGPVPGAGRGSGGNAVVSPAPKAQGGVGRSGDARVGGPARGR